MTFLHTTSMSSAFIAENGRAMCGRSTTIFLPTAIRKEPRSGLRPSAFCSSTTILAPGFAAATAAATADARVLNALHTFDDVIKTSAAEAALALCAASCFTASSTRTSTSSPSSSAVRASAAFFFVGGASERNFPAALLFATGTIFFAVAATFFTSLDNFARFEDEDGLTASTLDESDLFPADGIVADPRLRGKVRMFVLVRGKKGQLRVEVNYARRKSANPFLNKVPGRAQIPSGISTASLTFNIFCAIALLLFSSDAITFAACLFQSAERPVAA